MGSVIPGLGRIYSTLGERITISFYLHVLSGCLYRGPDFQYVDGLSGQQAALILKKEETPSHSQC
jgi:hypothetical protein